MKKTVDYPFNTNKCFTDRLYEAPVKKVQIKPYGTLLKYLKYT